ncbi:MAG: hypothetical protein WCF67_22740 [Chitinophagaceae bacterium]
MAESRNNVIIQGLSGKFGESVVFRQIGGKTFASEPPGPRTKEGTPGMKAQRSRFQQATVYGKYMMTDPSSKAAYKAVAPEGKTAYNMAVADFLLGPDINEIDLSAYTGRAGDIIRIQVTDDFNVASVTVAIQNEEGTMQEEGDAVRDANPLDWFYTATSDNLSLYGDKITITARDNPDNLTSAEKMM